MTNKPLFLVIHGPYGSGKTTLANTAPGPRLVLDGEGGSGFLENDSVYWNPLTEPDPPSADSLTKDTSVIVDVQGYDTYRAAIDIIKSGDHPFASLVIDSLTEVQRQILDIIDPTEDELKVASKADKTNFNVWKVLRDTVEKDVRGFRDLARTGSKHPIHVVIVSASKVYGEDPLKRAYLTGALRDSMSGFVDIFGYYHVEKRLVGSELVKVWVLDIDQHNMSVGEAKCRVPSLSRKFPNGIDNPSVPKILYNIYGPKAEPEEAK